MIKTDAQLVQDYLDGNEDSLNELVQNYVDPIYNFIYRLTLDKELSSDATQETFVKVWKNLKKYNSNKSFKVWIYSIARNTTIDWLRKRKNINFSQMDDEESDIEKNIPDTELLPDELSIIEENKSYVNEAVLKLSPKYQTVINLRYKEGLSFQEICEIIDKPENTVKSQHRRALAELKELLVASKLQTNS
jgi:RNA polymerase sigma-70 factor (ECF subfamily)